VPAAGRFDSGPARQGVGHAPTVNSSRVEGTRQRTALRTAGRVPHCEACNEY
jgi:hypothetical protein